MHICIDNSKLFVLETSQKSSHPWDQTLVFTPINIVSQPISSKTTAAASSANPRNFPNLGNHVLTHLCVSVDLGVSCKFQSFNFCTRIHHPFPAGIYFRKSENILWLKQCYGIIVMGWPLFHMALIKDRYNICETAVIPLLINKTVIQRCVRDVGMEE